MPSSTSTHHPQPPAEIYANIIEIAGIADRQTYHLDINTLFSLCLVSRFFHALATPILYSSIELATHEAILKIERISKANPRLLHHTRSLLFTSGNLHITAGWLVQTITQGAIRLQRLCIAGTFPEAGAFCRVDGPRGLHEFAALHSSPSANDPNFSFPFRDLRRLVLDRIDFRNSKMMTALAELRNLTHLAVVRFDVKRALGITSAGVDAVIDSPDLFLWNLGKYIEEAVSEPRVILGMIGETPSHREALVRKFDSLTPLSLPRVVFAPYSYEVEGRDWFRHKILDGTLWDMEC